MATVRKACGIVAPRAMRMPISLVRSTTDVAMRPWIPIADSRTATSARLSSSAVMNRCADPLLTHVAELLGRDKKLVKPVGRGSWGVARGSKSCVRRRGSASDE